MHIVSFKSIERVHASANFFSPTFAVLQDTVLGLQAMSEYWSVMSGNLNMNITVTLQDTVVGLQAMFDLGLL